MDFVRHTFATVMEGNRVNLKELSEVMGHRSSDFTMKTYVEKKQPVFEGIKKYLDILEHAAKERKTARAAPVRSCIIEYPGNLSVFTQIIQQARAPAGQADEKSLATHTEIPYNYSE